ncbi:MAG: AMP-binding protein, partial [Acidobacteriota bacterium]|nr:AMP-binding protein [Acidobacteriota bacterium]
MYPALAERGICAGQRVGLLAHNSGRFLEVVFGCLRCGVTPMCINTKLPAATIDFLCADASLELVLCWPA